MKRTAFGLVAVLSACLGLSSVAHGAAALANGAQTSAKPTAKDPVKKQMQIAADPVGITDFQFTLQYNPNILQVAYENESPLIRAINGYQLGLRNDPYADSFLIDAINGFVTVRGYWPANDGQAVPDYEIDVYDVVFELIGENDENTMFSIDALGVDRTPITEVPSLTFSALAPGFGDDFMIAGEVNGNGQVVQTRYYGPEEIIRSSTGSISFATVLVPLPTASVAALPGVALLLRRRRNEVV